MARPSSRVGLQFLVLLAVGGCTGRAVDECSRAYRRHQFAETVVACSKAFERTGRIEEAGKLAYGHYRAGQPEQARALLERYGTSTGLLLLTAAGLDWRSGKLEGAADRLSRAAQECRASGDSCCAARAELEAAALGLTTSDHRAALEAANRAASEPAAKQDAILATRAMLNVFDVLFEVGDAEGAERTLRALNELHPDDPASAPYWALKEGVLHKLLGRNALARRAYLRTLDAIQRTPSLSLEWSTRLNLVEVDLDDGRVEEASGELARAETLLARSPSRNAAVAFEYHRARVLHAQNDLGGATKAINEALRAIPNDDWAWLVQLERAEIAAASGDRPTALAATQTSIDALERLRASLGLDELKAWLLPNRRKPYELRFRLLAEQGDAVAALETAERGLARTLLDTFITARDVGAVSEVNDGREALARADILRGLLPALRASRVARPAPIIQSLQRVRRRQVLIYFVERESIWRFDISNGRPRLEKVPLELPALLRGAERLRANPADAAPATELGRVLLPRELQEEVAVVVSGPFAGLPFAVLRRDGHPLFENHVIEYFPSLSTLAALLDETPSQGGPPLVLGDSNGDLPAARTEAVLAGRVLGVEPLLGARAQRSELQRQQQPSVIHFSLHGGIGPLGSWVRLADGDLLSSDVLTLKLRPRLAVLSACGSAATRSPELWGSMSAAFLASGTRAVLGTLWSVQDAETLGLVERFYAEGGAQQPGRALARAQKWQSEQGAPASTWAAFVVLGL